MKNVYLYCAQLLSLPHAVRRQVSHNNTPITSSQAGDTITCDTAQNGGADVVCNQFTRLTAQQTLNQFLYPCMAAQQFVVERSYLRMEAMF